MTIGASQTEDAPADRGAEDAREADSGAAAAETEVASEAGQAAGIEAAVVSTTNGESSTYAMFEARDVCTDGAFLVGQLFFEVDETITLQLSAGGEAPVEVKARVVRLQREDLPGMTVAFQELGEAEREALSELVARASRS